MRGCSANCRPARAADDLEHVAYTTKDGAVTRFGSLIFIRGAVPMPPGHIRAIPIAVTTWPDEATRTSNSACVWTAEGMVETAPTPRDRDMAPPTSLRGSLSSPGSPIGR